MPAPCTTCGASIPAELQHCPRCLLALARGAAASARAVRRDPREQILSAERLAGLFPEYADFALIGAGGMGTVHRARHRRLERIVALKLLHADLAAEPAFAERFLREARALARLAHPSIVALHDIGERDGVLYLAMEHVDGSNLRTLVRAGPLAPRRALAIARELAAALEYAHAAGVVHRDVKPENVLIGPNGSMKLADFGLAKLVQDGAVALTVTGQVLGTLHYMAPEQHERPHSADHRADLYALGVVLYEMLTGSLPLGRFERPSRRSAVDADVDELVLRALEREPARRPQSAGELRAELERIVRDLDAATDAARSAPAVRAAPATASRSWKGALGSFALLSIAWLWCARAYDGGAWLLAAAAAVQALVLFAVFTWRLRASPELVARLARFSPVERAGRLACGVVAFAVAFGLLVFALQSRWALGTTLWSPERRGLEHFEALAARSMAADEAAGRTLVDALASRPELVVLAAALVLACGLGACAATRGAWSSWRGFWRPIAATMTLHVGSFVVLLAACWGLAALRRAPVQDGVLRSTCSTDARLAAVESAVRGALERERYRVTRWRPFDDERSAADAQRSGVLVDARPVEWIGAWRLGLDGPVCVRSVLRIVVLPPSDAAPRQVVVDAGVAPEGSEQANVLQRACEHVARSIEAELHVR
ncbi:MAG: serine/threonine protein kinase [Planctomycetes bacterium]|nr:serine/threonine protein kinase [Planctomycetota bacterium]